MAKKIVTKEEFKEIKRTNKIGTVWIIALAVLIIAVFGLTVYALVLRQRIDAEMSIPDEFMDGPLTYGEAKNKVEEANETE